MRYGYQVEDVLSLPDAYNAAVDFRALNARLRDEFVEDRAGGLRIWNRHIADHGIRP